MVTPQQKQQLKAQGYLPSRDGEHVAVRVITENGVVSSHTMSVIEEVAKKYGRDEITFTTRLTVEIPWIKFEDVDAVKKIFDENGIVTGGTGKKVRPLVSCKGTYCVFGLYDTQAFTKRLHKLFYEGYREVNFPHKVKIAVGGCPNNCVKPDLNDIGFVGQRMPAFDSELCRGCKKCQIEAACPIGAAKVKDGKLDIDRSLCFSCGRCSFKCPFKAVTPGKTGVKIYIAGRWGKQISRGLALDGIYTEDEAVVIAEKVMLLFKEQGYLGERFAQVVERIGFDKVKEMLRGDDLLARKEEIIAAPVKVRE